jgi:hypothetical protein
MNLALNLGLLNLGLLNPGNPNQLAGVRRHCPAIRPGRCWER